mmetsp:Transcript_551/g.869  ORF Transcript_551/g.869 Transcript_551/m.869 type:complete len:87 (+) Transcript_551:1048-1308(+)
MEREEKSIIPPLGKPDMGLLEEGEMGKRRGYIGELLRGWPPLICYMYTGSYMSWPHVFISKKECDESVLLLPPALPLISESHLKQK